MVIYLVYLLSMFALYFALLSFFPYYARSFFFFPFFFFIPFFRLGRRGRPYREQQPANVIQAEDPAYDQYGMAMPARESNAGRIGLIILLVSIIFSVALLAYYLGLI
ncbi:MAG: hypothetical protein M1162_02060 [Candidatus Thermoplasmatota archaeon]|nr:hypothetical protein [Candidatus Thermoplasmatota archaeon]